MRIVLKLLVFCLLAVVLFGLEQWLLNVYQPGVLTPTPVFDPFYAHLSYVGAVLFVGLVVFWDEMDNLRLRH